MISKERIAELESQIELFYPRYRGWAFTSMQDTSLCVAKGLQQWQKAFAYTKSSIEAPDDRWIDLWFTPQYEASGNCQIRFTNEFGETVADQLSMEYRHGDNVTAHELIAAARGQIDKWEESHKGLY